MIQAIVTDIEGTTSALSFVKEILFPYARAHLPEFVRARQDDPEVKKQIEEVRRIAGCELELEEVIAQLIRWSDADEKIPPLKALQGMIWEVGYRAGDFQGHVYPDAVAKLKAWKEEGYRLYVYSSGSVQAQKLLFGHTAWGDLTDLFSGFFDTCIGAKRDSESYRRIAAEIGLKPQQILFLSDVSTELEAAALAGMQVIGLARDGNGLESRFCQVRDFWAIDLSRFWAGVI